MNSETYTIRDWNADLAALGRELALKGTGDEQSVRNYTRAKYPDARDAEQRARLLILAIVFLMLHGKALEDEGFAVTGEKDPAHPHLAWVLYRLLVLMPRTGLVPAPNLEAVLAMMRGEQ